MRPGYDASLSSLKSAIDLIRLNALSFGYPLHAVDDDSARAGVLAVHLIAGMLDLDTIEMPSRLDQAARIALDAAYHLATSGELPKTTPLMPTSVSEDQLVKAEELLAVLVATPALSNISARAANMAHLCLAQGSQYSPIASASEVVLAFAEELDGRAPIN